MNQVDKKQIRHDEQTNKRHVVYCIMLFIYKYRNK